MASVYDLHNPTPSDDVTLSFRIHYQANYGKSLYVIGSIPEFGCWDISRACRMQWSQGHVWTATFTLEKDKNPMVIEYKYCVADTFLTQRGGETWEEGPNRSVVLRSLKKRANNVIPEVWGYRKVVIRLRVGDNQRISPDKMMCLKGSWLNTTECPNKMELVLKKDPVEGRLAVFWQYVFNIKSTESVIKYHYYLYDPHSNQSLWERDTERAYDLLMMMKLDSPGLNNVGANRKECVRFQYRKNTYKIVDSNFAANFAFYQLDDSVFVGPYPQTSEEIQFLRTHNIRAVLNLQSDEELSERHITWSSHQQKYKRYQISAHHMPVKPHEAHKIIQASELLNALVHNHGRVYLHCDDGITKSLLTLVTFYHLHQNKPLEDTHLFIREKCTLSPAVNERLMDDCAKLGLYSFENVKSETSSNEGENGQNNKNSEFCFDIDEFLG